MAPVILAVAPDVALRAALGDVLKRRYATDYSVLVADSPATSLQVLAHYQRAREQVALVLAPLRMPDLDGVPFLVEARRFHPTARRIVIIDVGDAGAAEELSQALTLSQIDQYFGQPWASPKRSCTRSSARRCACGPSITSLATRRQSSSKILTAIAVGSYGPCSIAMVSPPPFMRPTLRRAARCSAMALSESTSCRPLSSSTGRFLPTPQMTSWRRHSEPASTHPERATTLRSSVLALPGWQPRCMRPRMA